MEHLSILKSCLHHTSLQVAHSTCLVGKYILVDTLTSAANFKGATLTWINLGVHMSSQQIYDVQNEVPIILNATIFGHMIIWVTWVWLLYQSN